MDELEKQIIGIVNASPINLEAKAYVMKSVARTVALTYQTELLKAENIKLKGENT